MSSWSKATETVVSIVIGGFSVAAISTLMGEILTPRQELTSNHYPTHKLFVSTQANTDNVVGLKVARIYSPITRSSRQTEIFLKAPQEDAQFSFDSYHFKSLSEVKP